MTAQCSAQSINQRYRFLLSHSPTGLSIDVDHPTLIGCNSDHELAKSEAGRLRAATRTMD